MYNKNGGSSSINRAHVQFFFVVCLLRRVSIMSLHKFVTVVNASAVVILIAMFGIEVWKAVVVDQSCFQTAHKTHDGNVTGLFLTHNACPVLVPLFLLLEIMFAVIHTAVDILFSITHVLVCVTITPVAECLLNAGFQGVGVVAVLSHVLRCRFVSRHD